MTSTLLQTKLYVPAARPNLVERERLLARLDGARQPGCRCVLVSAPAGFGKTTLVTQWLARLDWQVSWVSLDEGDNNPTRFFRYLIAALRKALPVHSAQNSDGAKPPVGERPPGGATQPIAAVLSDSAAQPAGFHSAAALLNSARLDVEEIINALANELTDYAQPAVIVLDDYHHLHQPALHQAVRLLLDALPPHARLVLLSRQDPPLPVALLRARGQLIEIRPDELRFTARETAAFLNHAMGLDLTAAQIEALEARTEGWIAGLQMATIAMQSLSDRDRFIQAFSGSHRFILDYLVEEVLNRLSPEVEDFLLRTSILDRFCVELCREVMSDELISQRVKTVTSDELISQRGKKVTSDELESQRGREETPSSLYTHNSLTSNSSSTSSLITNNSLTSNYLTFIEHNNLFLIPLDDQRVWYRYHHLFADLLRARLKATRPELAPLLHRRAAGWLEANNDPKSALDHALAAGDYALAADILDRHLQARWRDPDLEFFLAVDKLPREVMHSRPSLCLQAAWMCVITGKMERVQALVEAAERHLLPARPSTLTAEAQGQAAFARVLRAYLDDYHNRPASLDSSIAGAIDAVPEDNVGMRNSIAVMLGMIYANENDFPTAARYFQDAIQRDKSASGTNAVPIAASRWARMLTVQGKLREAARLCRAEDAYVTERGAKRFYLAGNLKVMLGSVLCEWNQLAEAEALIRQGLQLYEGWPVPQAVLMGLSALARLQIAQGALSAAEQSLDQARAILRQYQVHPEATQVFETAQVRLWCARGDTTRLEDWLSASGAARPLTCRHEAHNLRLARAWLALGQTEEALALLRQMAGSARQGGRAGSLIEILAVLAAHLPQAQALPLLDEALTLARPEGYCRTFLDAAPAQASQALLSHLHALLPCPGNPQMQRYLQSVLDAAGPAPTGGTAAPPPAHRAHAAPSPAPAQPAELVEPLSEREVEVLRLVARGLSNQQIADELVISIRTVKKHLQNVNGKLGVSSRVQAINRAREFGLLK